MEAAAQMLMEFGVWQIQSFMKMSGREPNPINFSCSFIDLFFMPWKAAEYLKGGEKSTVFLLPSMTRFSADGKSF